MANQQENENLQTNETLQHSKANAYATCVAEEHVNQIHQSLHGIKIMKIDYTNVYYHTQKA